MNLTDINILLLIEKLINKIYYSYKNQNILIDNNIVYSYRLFIYVAYRNTINSVYRLNKYVICLLF
jgi:hypothetical protein